MADPAWVDGVTPLNSVNMTKLQTRDEKGQPNGYAALDSSGQIAAGQISGGGVPTGAAIDFFGTTLPSGYLSCDGSAVSRSTYAALFAALSTTYGAGDGSSTFNLPDTRGRVIVGISFGGNTEVGSMGSNDGTAAASRRVRHAHTNALAANHNLTLPDHWHTVYDPSHSHVVHSWTESGGGNNLSASTQASDSIQSSANVDPAVTGIQVQSPQSFPAINGGVSVSGTIGVTGGTADGPSFVVAGKVIKT